MCFVRLHCIRRCVNVLIVRVGIAARPVRCQGRAARTEMPVISVGRDKLFKSLGREYSKLLLLCIASASFAPQVILDLACYSIYCRNAINTVWAHICTDSPVVMIRSRGF